MSVCVKDDGVVESPICGALRAMRCSMHEYARPRQQGSQIIHIWNFRPRHRPVTRRGPQLSC